MENLAKAVAQVVGLSGGTLTGRTRLQKALYFLEEREVGFGFDYDYYHYGPYSEDLADAAKEAVELGLISLEWKTANSGMPYALYQSSSLDLGGDVDLKRRKILELINTYDSITVELAATADYLEKHGYDEDPWTEVKTRKAGKFTTERVRKAKELLQELQAV